MRAELQLLVLGFCALMMGCTEVNTTSSGGNSDQTQQPTPAEPVEEHAEE